MQQLLSAGEHQALEDRGVGQADRRLLALRHRGPGVVCPHRSSAVRLLPQPVAPEIALGAGQDDALPEMRQGEAVLADRNRGASLPDLYPFALQPRVAAARPHVLEVRPDAPVLLRAIGSTDLCVVSAERASPAPFSTRSSVLELREARQAVRPGG